MENVINSIEMERQFPVFNFSINAPSDASLNEEALHVRQRKLEEAKKNLTQIEGKIQELQVMLRRLTRKPRFHKLQYVLKHRIAVFSGLRSVYLKYCCNLQEEINQLQNF